MWYENLNSHYKIELEWLIETENENDLELIIIKNGYTVDSANILYEDSDGRVWIEKTQESRLSSPCRTAKILWCMKCCITVLIRSLYLSEEVTNIRLSIYKEDTLIQSFEIDETLFCDIAKLPVCEINIPNNLYDLPVINELPNENEEEEEIIDDF